MLDFIADPSELFIEYLNSTGTTPRQLDYQLGQMSMALEIITQIKTLEELKPLTSDTGRAEAVGALVTLLTDCGMLEVAYEMYSKLNQWRRHSFVPAP